MGGSGLGAYHWRGVSLFIPNQGTLVVSCGRIVVYTLKS